MKRIITMLALLGLVGSATASDYWFDHSTDPVTSDFWSDLANWNTDALPTAADRVMLYPNAGAGGLSRVDVVSTVSGVQFVAATNELEILSSGSLSTTQPGEGAEAWFILGGNAGQVHTVTVNGGAISVACTNGAVTIGDLGTGILNISSGSFTTTNGIHLTWDKAGSVGEINITGGLLDVGDLWIRSFGTLTMSGGQVVIRDKDVVGYMTDRINNGRIVGPVATNVYFDGTDTIINMGAIAPPPTYELWAEEQGLVGAQTNRTADLENGGLGDGMENLLEYVLGGDPLAEDAEDYLPTSEFTADKVVYVYRRRRDAGLRNLVYELTFNIDGLQQPWTDLGSGVGEVGKVNIDADFESVTNELTITGIELGFVNLKVTEN